VSVVSTTPDICNARLEFENGCVVNLTASRMSMKQMRKLRLFQKDAYISIDFLAKEAQIIQLLEYNGEEGGMTIDTSSGKKLLKIEAPEIDEFNAIQKEFEMFHDAIDQDIEVPVPLTDGVKALELALKIDSIVASNLENQRNSNNPN
jgi:predicted dehydrogenase